MSDAQSLTLALGGRWYRSYGVACCPAHGDTRPSLTLADADDGRLLLNCKAGCAFLSILDAIKARGLLGGDYRALPHGPAELSRKKAEAEAEAAKVEKRALACWREALPIDGTIAETYLRGRGITCALPESLRYHPECWHPSAQRAPAMVARIDGLPRLAIHRTYLRPDGSGKAGLEPAKAMLGAALGGAVRVAGGGGPLVVAEGVETALSLPSGLLRASAQVWAALSTAGIASLRLPSAPASLIVAADGDAPGKAAGLKLADRAAALGWTVTMFPAPDGRDWNDVIRNKKGDAA